MKKKLSDFWYYHKWYVLFALLVLWAAGDFFTQRAENPEPDAAISFVTMKEISWQTREALRELAAQTIGDANGDGRVEVTVNVYAYDGKGSDSQDPEAYAAAAVHLAAEIRLGLTDFFVTDQPGVFQDNGTLRKMGTWSSYASLAALEDGSLADFEVYAFSDSSLALLGALK